MSAAIVLNEPSLQAIETDRLVLRVPEEAECARIAKMANERAIAENTARLPHPYTEDDARRWLRSLGAGERDETAFGVYLNIPKPVLIGVAGIVRTNEGAEPDLGFWIGSPYQGRGFATEAAQAVISHAFARMDLAALRSGCRITNAASRRVLEKCGFGYIGLGRRHIRALGRVEPIDLFRLTREQRNARRARQDNVRWRR